MSAADEAIRAGFKLGFRADEAGNIIAPGGRVVKTNRHHKTGYLYASLRGVRSGVSVHRFVAYQLFGDAALSAQCVRHLDGNRQNNAPANIAYGTKSQNQFDIPEAKRREMGRKRNRHKRRFTDEQVREIRALLAAGWSLKRLRGQYGGGYGSLANIRDRVSYYDVA